MANEMATKKIKIAGSCRLVTYHCKSISGHKVKKVTRRHGGGGGVQSDPSPLLLTPFIRLTRYLAHIICVPFTFN